jgi:hypothetical protein
LDQQFQERQDSIQIDRDLQFKGIVARHEQEITVYKNETKIRTRKAQVEFLKIKNYFQGQTKEQERQNEQIYKQRKEKLMEKEEQEKAEIGRLAFCQVDKQVVSSSPLLNTTTLQSSTSRLTKTTPSWSEENAPQTPYAVNTITSQERSPTSAATVSFYNEGTGSHSRIGSSEKAPSSTPQKQRSRVSSKILASNSNNSVSNTPSNAVSNSPQTEDDRAPPRTTITMPSKSASNTPSNSVLSTPSKESGFATSKTPAASTPKSPSKGFFNSVPRTPHQSTPATSRALAGTTPTPAPKGGRNPLANNVLASSPKSPLRTQPVTPSKISATSQGRLLGTIHKPANVLPPKTPTKNFNGPQKSTTVKSEHEVLDRDVLISILGQEERPIQRTPSQSLGDKRKKESPENGSSPPARPMCMMIPLMMKYLSLPKTVQSNV